jgi:hypothetical protein
MRIALIDASPKVKAESSSAAILEELSRLFPKKEGVVEFKVNRNALSPDVIGNLLNFDVWVFAVGIYVDGLPSHLLSCLRQLEAQGKGRSVRVYSILSCGFYEGEHAEVNSHHGEFLPQVRFSMEWRNRLRWCPSPCWNEKSSFRKRS